MRLALRCWHIHSRSFGKLCSLVRGYSAVHLVLKEAHVDAHSLKPVATSALPHSNEQKGLESRPIEIANARKGF